MLHARAIRMSALFAGLLLFPVGAAPAQAQATGSVAGTVTSVSGLPLSGVRVTVDGSSLVATSAADGRYTLPGVAAGSRVVRFERIGLGLVEREIEMAGGTTVTLDVVMQPSAIILGGIVVTTASRVPEPLLEAPAALSVVDNVAVRDVTIGGQAPQALVNLPGIDVAQNGIFDYNVNARGFNTALNRRVLVLQDGRDLAFAFIGSQEWASQTLPIEDGGTIEFVRGPGSALYGANAYNGVLNIVTPRVRDTPGTRIGLVGGELNTLRADIRHARPLGDGRYALRLNAGYYGSDSWSVSRTSPDDFAREYAAAIDTSAFPVNTPFPGFELRPLNGQSLSGGLGSPAIGDPDPLRNMYATARLDRYSDGGRVLTIEAGAGTTENEVGLTGVGRVQIDKAIRPWARVAWETDRTYASAWYSGRRSLEPRWSLAAGSPQETESYIAHAEVQHSRTVAEGRGTVVGGASIRNGYVDSRGTIMLPANDGRSDWSYAAFGQFDYELTPDLRFVAAARIDAGDLFSTEFSPKAALVFQPDGDHAFRLTWNRAFQTPNIVEYFLAVPFGAPADFSGLEAGLRASPLGGALAAVPDGELFTTSASVPVLALGNESLEVEHISSFELGYKGEVDDRLFLTLDLYYSRLSNLVTGLLPGVNPAFAPWTVPSALAEPDASAVQAAVFDALVGAGEAFAAAGLTRLPDGSTAVVVSVGNAARATEYGLEVGATAALTPTLSLGGNYAFVDAEIDAATLAAGDQVRPNTPANKGNVVLTYDGQSGFDARLGVRLVEPFDWAVGIYGGRVPASQTADLSAGYQVGPNVRVQLSATNLLDQQRYHAYGASVIGRRVLGGVTFTF